MALGQASARSAELIMFEQRGCPYCAAFEREVAPVYPLTEEGRAIPLRRVNIAAPIPSDLGFLKVERLTPVFVLVEAGREIGRIRGYAGEDHFWGLYGVLIERLRMMRGAATPAAPQARLAAPSQR
jgi:thioredoxin-related protein